MKYFNVLISILVYIFLLFTSYYLYIYFFKINVVFYSSLYSALIAIVFFSVGVFFTPLLKRLSNLEKIQTVVICILCGYIFSISLPTVIDRSLSFYILEKLQQRGGGIQLSKFNYIFTNEYVREHRLVDIRLTEQTESGTITIEGDCVKLTSKGYALASFSRFFRQHLLPKKRLLRGEYTDALIDPFARSDERPDYLCN